MTKLLWFVFHSTFIFLSFIAGFTGLGTKTDNLFDYGLLMGIPASMCAGAFLTIHYNKQGE
jgi:hypothetical protein